MPQGERNADHLILCVPINRVLVNKCELNGNYRHRIRLLQLLHVLRVLNLIL